MVAPPFTDTSLAENRLKILLYTLLIVEAIAKVIMISLAVPEDQGE